MKPATHGRSAHAVSISSRYSACARSLGAPASVQSFGREGDPSRLGQPASMKQERLALAAHHRLDAVEVLGPGAGRVVAARGDDVDGVPPGQAVLLVLVAVVRDQPSVHLAHLRDEGTPVRLLAVGSDHLAADAEQLDVELGGQPGVVQHELAVRREPLRPRRLARHVHVEEADVRAPGAVGHVHDGLEAHLQTTRTGGGDRATDLVVRHRGCVAERDVRRLGGRLDRRVGERHPVHAELGHRVHRPFGPRGQPGAAHARPPPGHATDLRVQGGVHRSAGIMTGTGTATGGEPRRALVPDVRRRRARAGRRRRAVPR